MSGLLDSVFRPMESSGSSSFMDFLPFISGNKSVATVQSALTLSAFYNAVDQLSNDIAKLPKHVYRREGKTSKKYLEHPLNYLIATEPNEMMSAFDFWKVVIVLVILKGNCFVLIKRNNIGIEESLIIQDNGDVRVRREGDKLFYFIKGEVYLSKQVLHFKAFSLDGILGVSVIRYAAHNLGVSLDAQQYASDIYATQGLGYGVIESEKTVQNEAKKLISDGFSKKMSEKNKFKVPVLDEGLKYKSISVTPAEAQFLETNKYSVIEIARWLNIAPHKLKDLTNANYRNIQAQSIEHVQDSLLPWIGRIELELNRKMFSREDSDAFYVKLNEKVLLRGDSEARKNYLTQLVYAGIITRNEARAMEDLDSIEGLDEPLTPVHSQLLDFVMKKNEKELKDEKD